MFGSVLVWTNFLEKCLSLSSLQLITNFVFVSTVVVQLFIKPFLKLLRMDFANYKTKTMSEKMQQYIVKRRPAVYFSLTLKQPSNIHF